MPGIELGAVGILVLGILGLAISVNDLEAHYLAGGNVVRVVRALISADKANINMPFRRAAAIDLAGRDVLEAVKMSVIPKVIENPDDISKYILGRGLDAGTAFEILSIDIADVDVGKNIGAKLQIDQADADKQIAQAKAKERRAMAVALEQEMQVRVVEAEAEVPLAMAQAFRSGNLGIMDYSGTGSMRAGPAAREPSRGPGREPPAGDRT